MFSAFKKLTSGKVENETQSGTPRGLQTMSHSLQKKFSKGVQYNMKIIIKGDRNVGKTCLFRRLQGQPFSENYISTEEIQVTNIQWNYKVTDDIVKVEIWDVVDKGKKRVLTDNLKIEQCSAQPAITTALDAEFIDVYKRTNGVILVMDITKSWTFEYVQREINKIPETIPVLILGNHCDMAHHRTITADQVIFYSESLNRSTPVRYAESSMYNGFGLKFLHKWFNMPFLQLQRETLIAQLDTNKHEMGVITQELDIFQQSNDSNYEKFNEKLSNYRRKVAESNSVIPTSSAVIHTQNLHKIDAINAINAKVSSTSHLSSANNPELRDSKVYGRGQEIKPEKSKSPHLETVVSSRLDMSLRNIEEFIPDESLDKSFLDESPSTQSNSVNQKTDDLADSDGDEPNGNPLVAEFQDDIDPTDEFVQRGFSVLQIKTADIVKSDESSSIYEDKWLHINETRLSPDGDEDNSSIDNSNKDAASVSKIEKFEPVVEAIKTEKVRKSKKTSSGSDINKKDKKKKHSKKENHRNKEQDDLERFLNSSGGGDSFYEIL